MHPDLNELPAWTDHYFLRSKATVQRFGDKPVTYAVFMSKVHQDGTLEVQSPPTILLSTKLMGWSWPAKAGCFWAFQRSSSSCRAFTSGKQASMALAPRPA